MIKCRSEKQVLEQVAIRMKHEITGLKKKKRDARLKDYQRIMVIFWREFGVDLNSLHWSHIIMYFTICPDILKLSAATRYRHFRFIKEILSAIQVLDEWQEFIHGDWCDPDGIECHCNNNKSGRKPKFY
jgi:hypothetical protein